MFSFAKLTSVCYAAVAAALVLQLTSSVIALPNDATKQSGHGLVDPQQFNADTGALAAATFQPGCTPEQQAQVNAAIPIATGHINDAYAYIQQFGGVPQPNDARLSRYKTWFGEFSQNNWNEVATRVAALHDANAKFDEYHYTCNDPRYCTETLLYAYVLPHLFRRGAIGLCPTFFSALASNGITRAHVLIHESTHFNVSNVHPGTNADTKEWYASVGAWGLARASPNKAVVNADNYAWFARNAQGCDLVRCNIL